MKTEFLELLNEVCKYTTFQEIKDFIKKYFNKKDINLDLFNLKKHRLFDNQSSTQIYIRNEDLVATIDDKWIKFHLIDVNNHDSVNNSIICFNKNNKLEIFLNINFGTISNPKYYLIMQENISFIITLM